MVGIWLLFGCAHFRGAEQDSITQPENLFDGGFRLLVLVGQFLRGLSLEPVIPQDGPVFCQADILVQAVVDAGVQRVLRDLHLTFTLPVPLHIPYFL